MRSGWNASSPSIFSLMPANRIGLPVTCLADSAAPPRASPSILLRMRPVRPTRSSKLLATGSDCWPVMASTTRMRSVGCSASRSAAISAISGSSICERPAVSTMTRSRKSCRSAASSRRSGDRARLAVADLEHRHADLPAEDAQLLARGGALGVGGDQQRPAALGLVLVGELAGGGRLAGALQADEHPHVAVVAQLQLHRLAAEHGDQLLVHDRDDALVGVERQQRLGADRLLLHPGDQVAGHLEVDVGLEQRDAHLAQGRLDVGLAELAAAAQAVEDVLESIAEALEHGVLSAGRAAAAADGGGPVRGGAGGGRGRRREPAPAPPGRAGVADRARDRPSRRRGCPRPPGDAAAAVPGLRAGGVVGARGGGRGRPA
jgi:hypothetical protein